MNVILIGSGNVATILGKRLQTAGHRILQVMSRNLAHAEVLAKVLGAEAVTSPRRDADLYVMATGDEAIYAIAGTLRLDSALVVHTAGSVPIGALSPISTRYGVLYPLQSLHKEVDAGVAIPFLIDGAGTGVRDTLWALAGQLSNSVRICTDQERLFFHIGAVIVNNFPNYLYTLTDAYLAEEGLDFKLLLPLLTETVRRLDKIPARSVQTGPAVRGDRATMALHRELLEGYPELRHWYELFSINIAKHYHID
jgi:predicted short-subunit dehydrogenase-like oxidoreductase (DUF2520 family)